MEHVEIKRVTRIREINSCLSREIRSDSQVVWRKVVGKKSVSPLSLSLSPLNFSSVRAGNTNDSRANDNLLNVETWISRERWTQWAANLFNICWQETRKDERSDEPYIPNSCSSIPPVRIDRVPSLSISKEFRIQKGMGKRLARYSILSILDDSIFYFTSRDQVWLNNRSSEIQIREKR